MTNETDKQDKFDSRVADWNAYMQTPWGRLQNSTRLHNLRKHIAQIDAPSLDILDAGGGNGVETMPLAAEGHRLTLLDASQAMLSDGMRLSAESNLPISTVCGSVLDLDQLVSANRYDLVLLHNVIQYLPEASVPALVKSLYRTVKPGGLLSLVTVNRHSAIMAKAIVHAEFADALSSIGSTHQYSRAFDHDVRVYDSAEMSTLLTNGGFTVTHHYGVRLFIDYIADNGLKHDPDQYAQLEALEHQLSGQSPYKETARTFQLIAQRPTTP